MSIPILGQRRNLGGGGGTTTGKMMKVGGGAEPKVDCSLNGKKFCSGLNLALRYHFDKDNAPLLMIWYVGSVVQSFVFGIVRVCVDGKLMVMRKDSLDENIKIRDNGEALEGKIEFWIIQNNVSGQPF